MVTFSEWERALKPLIILALVRNGLAGVFSLGNMSYKSCGPNGSQAPIT